MRVAIVTGFLNDTSKPHSGVGTIKDCRRAKTIANVILHGPAIRGSVPEFYKKARIMCCTSDFEGFLNTFLEAWSYGFPMLSTFDPVNLIVNKNMGIVARDVKGLATGIRTFLGDPQHWRQASEAARRYYLENHTIDAVMPRFENIFNEIMNTTQSVSLKK